MSDLHSTLHFQAPAQSDSGSDSDETMEKYVSAPSPPPSYHSSAGLLPQDLQNTAAESRDEHYCPDFNRQNSKTRTRPYSWPQEENSTSPQEEKSQKRKTVSPSLNHINPGPIILITKHRKWPRRQQLSTMSKPSSPHLHALTNQQRPFPPSSTHLTLTTPQDPHKPSKPPATTSSTRPTSRPPKQRATAPQPSPTRPTSPDGPHPPPRLRHRLPTHIT